MVLTKEIFEQLDLPDLLLNIWSNADKLHLPILHQYAKCNIEIARSKWKNEYQAFDTIIEKIKKRQVFKFRADFIC